MHWLSVIFQVNTIHSLAFSTVGAAPASKIYGDGGVDVTGAADVILVEGANMLLVNPLPFGGDTFDWRTFRSSNSNVEE
jgi:hypothetical protein